MRRTRLRRASPRTQGKRALWARVRARVLERAGGRCEVLSCRQPTHEVHHVVKRSQGGPHAPDNGVALCRVHHDQTDAPYSRGRLVIRRIGEGFSARIETAPDKWAARTA
ncbi:MAG TPA: hypothetical protein DCQ64_01235 [Candidatus Rokubacteria bacterium]|nr:hypothetical protein [Candidatus Rokubacteria bacterium]